MNNQIDLHGYNIDEATAKLMSALFSFDNDHYARTLKIICGRGSGAIKNRVLTILDQEDRKYIARDVEVIIFKNDNNDEFDIDDNDFR